MTSALCTPFARGQQGCPVPSERPLPLSAQCPCRQPPQTWLRVWVRGLLCVLLLGACLDRPQALGIVRSAHAAQDNDAVLVPLPVERARSLAPLLRTHDVALVESNPNGSFKQLTLLTLVAARPDVVRDVVLHAERYPDFIRNLSNTQVSKNPDGTFDHAFQVTYGFVGFASRNRFATLPPPAPLSAAGTPSPDALGPADVPSIELYDPNPAPYGNRHLRFDFIAAGGGTVLALYAYTNLPGSLEFVRRFLTVTPLFEHGIAITTALTFALSIKARAEQLTTGPGVILPAAGAAGYDFLLERGPVALFRNSQGRLHDTSLITLSTAGREALLDATRHASRWQDAIPIIGRSVELSGPDDQPVVDLQLALPLFSFHTRYALRTMGYSVDLLGIAGDLVGSRLRWDVLGLPRPEPVPAPVAVPAAEPAPPSPVASAGPAPMLSKLILRGQQQLDRASLVLRQLYRIEPLMEYGVNLSLYLVLLQSVRSQAERSQPTASH